MAQGNSNQYKWGKRGCLLRSEQEDVDLSVGDLIYDCGLGLKGIIFRIRQQNGIGAPYGVLYEPLSQDETGHTDYAMRHDLELRDNQTVRKRNEEVRN